MYLEAPGLRIYDLNADPLNPRLLWVDSGNGGHDATVVGDPSVRFSRPVVPTSTTSRIGPNPNF